MKIALTLLALISSQSLVHADERFNQFCADQVRTIVVAADSSYLPKDDNTGVITIENKELAAVKISNVKIIRTECSGPADCDDRHPDTFIYKADVGVKGEGINGSITSRYHRGLCFVEKVSIKN